MLSSELKKCKEMIWPTCSLVKLTDVYVGLVPGIHLIREKYTSVELRQKAIDDLRLREENYWWYRIKGKTVLMV